jgi:pimeloyl-ACP methyl ester carboxylesterase
MFLIKGFGLDEFVQKRNLWHFGFFQVPGLAESLAEGRERLLLQTFFSGIKNPAALTQDDIDEYVRCYSSRDALRTGFEYYRAYPYNEQQFKEYSKQKLHISVLALGGENSGAGFPFYSLAQLAENVSGGIILQCGHYVQEEQPEELVRRLNAFFSEEEKER